MVAAMALATVLVLLLPAGAGATFPGSARYSYIAWTYHVDPAAGTTGGDYYLDLTGVGDTLERDCSDGANRLYCFQWDDVAFSPNGRLLLWVITTEKHHQVIIKGAPNTIEGHQTIEHRNENDTYPAFAPSGDEIAYARSVPHFPAELAISNLTGGAVRVVEKRLAPADIKFSPGGQTLIFTHGSSVYSVGVDGEGLRPLITNATAPDFSPDGRQIAYIGTKTGAVYLADADGDDRRQVAITGLCQPTGSCVGNVGAVVFSPDGKKLAYASADRMRNPALFEVAVGGGHPKEIDSGSDDRPGQTTGLSWQP